MKTKIYENDKNKNGLQTKTIIYKTPIPILHKSYIEIPKWHLFIYILTFAALFTILAAAIAVVYNAPPPALYKESCDKRSCQKSLNMKCINGSCQCTSEQYFTNKCESKRENMEFCWKDYQCKDYLRCRDGKCQCASDYYDSKGKCIQRKTYGQSCNGDQCLTSSMLYCDTITDKCICPLNRF